MLMGRKQKVDLLSAGYSRAISNNTAPKEISQLIELFYDDYFYWSLTQEEIKTFSTAKNQDVIYNPNTFKIQDIEFECTICPNGWAERAKGFVQFFMEVKNMPPEIEYCIAVFHMKCETSKTLE